MSMSANLHDAVSAEATTADRGTSWLTIRAKNGDHVSIFMPYATAQAMAAAFNAPIAAPVLEKAQ